MKELKKSYPELCLQSACIQGVFCKYRDKILFGITLRKWQLPLCGLLLIPSTERAGHLPTLRRYFPLNIFSATSGEFAKVAAIFLPLIPTNQQKAKWTLICRNSPSLPTTPHKLEQAGIYENFFSPTLHGQLADLPNGRGKFFLSPFARHNTGDF